MKKTIVAIIILVSSISNAQTFKPGVKLQAGKNYTINTIFSTSTTQEVMGQKMEIPMENKTIQLLQIKEATNQGFQSSLITNSLKFSTSIMGNEMGYDSDKKEDRSGKMSKNFNHLLNTPTTFIVNEDGRIIDKSIVLPPAPKNSEEDGNMFSSMMGNFETAQTSVCPVFNLFDSTNEMKIGDSFEEKTNEDDKQGKSTTSITYTLKEIKEGVATFNFIGKGHSIKKMEMMGMQTKATINTKYTGIMLVNTANGLLIKKTTEIEIGGITEAAGMEIPSVGKSTITIVVDELK